MISKTLNSEMDTYAELDCSPEFVGICGGFTGAVICIFIVSYRYWNPVHPRASLEH